MGCLKAAKFSVENPQQLKHGLPDQLKLETMIDPQLPHHAVFDAKDVELLSRLAKKSGRPTNYNKKLHQFLSQVKSSLLPHD
mgnify:CR=1 FL=1